MSLRKREKAEVGLLAISEHTQMSDADQQDTGGIRYGLARSLSHQMRLYLLFLDVQQLKID
jgi:hypothetical protein